MATTSSIGSGKTYSSLSAWHAAFAAGGWIGEVYGELTESFNFTGASTSAVNYIILRAASGQGVAAITSSGPLRYDGTKGGAVKDNNNYGSVFFINEDYVTLSGLQLAEQHSNGAWVVSNSILGASNCVIENCILEGSGGGNDATIRMRIGLVRNTLIVNRSSANNGVDLSYSSPTFVNCTIVRTGTATGDGFKNLGAGSAVVKNCAVFGFTNFATSGLTLTGSDYNASDKTIPIGSHNQASKTYSAQFQSITDSTRDFRPKTGADLLDNGVTDTTNVPSATDAIGTSRPQGTAWDIGAWELASAPSGITGSASITEADDTVSAAGKLAIKGTLSITEAGDTVSSTATLKITGTVSVTEGADTLSSTGTLKLKATLSVTEADDTVAAAGALAIHAAASITESDDTVAAVATLKIAGTVSITEADDTVTAAGQGSSANTGQVAITEADDTLTATGALKIAAAVAITEADDTVAAAGALRISAAVSIVEADDSVTSAAALRITGAVSIVEGDDTLVATAGHGIQGAVSITEADDTVAATAKLRIAGAVSITEGNDTLVATGAAIIAAVLTVDKRFLFKTAKQSFSFIAKPSNYSFKVK